MSDPRVLLFDADSDLREALAEAFRVERIECLVMRSVDELRASLKDGPKPAAVIFCVAPPPELYVEVLRELQGSSQLKDVPVLVTTTFLPTIVPEGMTPFIFPKPFDIALLLGALHLVLLGAVEQAAALAAQARHR